MASSIKLKIEEKASQQPPLSDQSTSSLTPSNNELRYPQSRVERILHRKIDKGHKLYLVKWEGYSESQSTWEPAENLLDAIDSIIDFEVSERLHNPDLFYEKREMRERDQMRSIKREPMWNLGDHHSQVKKKIKKDQVPSDERFLKKRKELILGLKSFQNTYIGDRETYQDVASKIQMSKPFTVNTMTFSLKDVTNMQIESSESEEPPVVKRPRGRPRKIKFEEEPNEESEGEEEEGEKPEVPKRPRGRPKKNIKIEGSSEFPKRPRGRPKKIREENEGDQNNVQNEGEVVKRPRGRPRKVRKESEEEEEEDEAEIGDVSGEKDGNEGDNEEGEMEIRRRLRDRPNRVEPEPYVKSLRNEVVPGVKRPRGRPKKVRPEGEETKNENEIREKTNQSEAAVGLLEDGSQVVKRKRGRPKKAKSLIPEGVKSEKEEGTRAQTGKRKRGRPKKVQNTVEIGSLRIGDGISNKEGSEEGSSSDGDRGDKEEMKLNEDQKDSMNPVKISKSKQILYESESEEDPTRKQRDENVQLDKEESENERLSSNEIEGEDLRDMDSLTLQLRKGGKPFRVIKVDAREEKETQMTKEQERRSLERVQNEKIKNKKLVTSPKRSIEANEQDSRRKEINRGDKENVRNSEVIPKLMRWEQPFSLARPDVKKNAKGPSTISEILCGNIQTGIDIKSIEDPVLKFEEQSRKLFEIFKEKDSSKKELEVKTETRQIETHPEDKCFEDPLLYIKFLPDDMMMEENNTDN